MSNLKTPLASFIMPNFNYSQYLGTAIQAILNQTFTNFEIIFVDDASTDNSLEVLNTYQKKDSRIRLIQHKKNQGVIAAVHTGVEAARGKYITFSSSDDIHLPTFLEKNVQALEDNPEAGLSFSEFATFNSKMPTEITRVWNAQSNQSGVLDTKQLMHAIKMHRFWIAGNTVLCRKDLFLQAGGFQSKFYSLTDWFLLLKIAFLHKAYFIPEVLGALRVHDASYSTHESIENKKLAWNNIMSELSERKNAFLKHAFVRSHIFNTFGFPFFDYAIKSPKAWWFFKQYTYKHFYKRWKKEKRKKSIA